MHAWYRLKAAWYSRAVALPSAISAACACDARDRSAPGDARPPPAGSADDAEPEHPPTSRATISAQLDPLGQNITTGYRVV
jgi:hypothetical protein